MKENITSLILAIACFVIAKAHFKGNVSSIHSYHLRRIQEENLKDYAKTMGTGMLIIGLGCLMNLLARLFHLFLLGKIGVVIGLVVGIVMMIYAQMKYNHGIF